MPLAFLGGGESVFPEGPPPPERVLVIGPITRRT